jgi:hypothetical protein
MKRPAAAAPRRRATTGRPSHGTQGPLRQRDGQNGKQRQQDAPLEEPSYRPSRRDPIRIYPFGVARNRLDIAAKNLGVPVVLTREMGDSQVLVTLRTHYRKRQRSIVDAERRGMPVYVLRSNTVNQMERFLAGLFDLAEVDREAPSEVQIVDDTQRAIDAVLNGERWVELPPAASTVRRIQHQMAKEARLISHSYGKEPNRRVRIFRE